jgi:hypothetical protein
MNSSQPTRNHVVKFLYAGGSRRTFFYQHCRTNLGIVPGSH